MRKAIIGAVAVLWTALPQAGTAQIGSGLDPRPGTGAVTIGPPGMTPGGSAGPAIGSTDPYYRESAHRDRVCWHDRGYRHCRWR